MRHILQQKCYWLVWTKLLAFLVFSFFAVKYIRLTLCKNETIEHKVLNVLAGVDGG
jgi:hypothetical protein